MGAADWSNLGSDGSHIGSCRSCIRALALVHHAATRAASDDQQCVHSPPCMHTCTAFVGGRGEGEGHPQSSTNLRSSLLEREQVQFTSAPLTVHLSTP